MNTIACLALMTLSPSATGDELLAAFRQEFVVLRPPSEALAGANNQRLLDLAPLPDFFAVCKYEVTQNIWQEVMGTNPSRWQGRRNSVERVSRDDARTFCQRVTDRLRRLELIEPEHEIRLPTEQEWECVVRAGTATRYSFGDDPAQLSKYAWYQANAAGNDPPVGAKRPNPWGLYDVHGYLWEWCDNADRPLDGNERTEGLGVVRGGSWKDPANLLTSDSRRVVGKDLKDDSVGFRCVIALVSQHRKAGGTP